MNIDHVTATERRQIQLEAASVLGFPDLMRGRWSFRWPFGGGICGSVSFNWYMSSLFAVKNDDSKDSGIWISWEGNTQSCKLSNTTLEEGSQEKSY